MEQFIFYSRNLSISVNALKNVIATSMAKDNEISSKEWQKKEMGFSGSAARQYTQKFK